MMRAVRMRGVRRFEHVLRFRMAHSASDTNFSEKSNVLEFADQTVYAGTAALTDLAAKLAERGMKKPLLVSDPGVVELGIADDVIGALKARGIDFAMYGECQANPAVADVQGIAKAFLKNGCDICIGVGGGGPMDAAKAAIALVGEQRAVAGFNIDEHTGEFITVKGRKYAATVTAEALAAVPMLCAVPTTAGTGSDGGKSAVIVDSNGQKVVMGHPRLMPAYAALAPQLTVGLPRSLTLATGVDALFHCLEPLFCPTDIMMNRDKMTKAEIEYCDSFALHGIRLVKENLPRVVDDPSHLLARLNMQVAALYGAKAFRKGDLGGVHATAHALGALYHQHHGSCVARMAVPVLEYNETHPDFSPEAVKVADSVRQLFSGVDTMHQAIEAFLRSFGVPLGISDMVEFSEDLDALADLAANDACQTNPIPLSRADYRQIFENAYQMAVSEGE